MAGFVGAVESPESVLNAMSSALAQRGPDNVDLMWDGFAEVGFSHTRLAIQDVSGAGNQPMWSQSGNICITFNGEIYNHLELRAELSRSASIKWRSTSDTETLIELIEFYGIDAALEKIEGMFAFAIFDKPSSKLYLARDSFGEKPLYYSRSERHFIFGSTIAALRWHPNFKPRVCQEAVGYQIQFGYIPAPLTIYQSAKKVPPGCYVVVSCDGYFGLSDNGERIVRYWNLKEVITRAKSSPITDYRKAKQELDRLLKGAVRRRMIADVPVGAFLSGGVDSSLVTAVMQSVSGSKVQSFSVGFRDKRYDEAGHASRVAQHIGTDHTEIQISQDDLLETVALLPQIYDEPFSDSSQLPTVLLSMHASRQVKVALTGDGGDEIFMGYNRHRVVSAVWPLLQGLPPVVRGALSKLIFSIPPARWDRIFLFLNHFFAQKYHVMAVGDKVHKVAGALTCRNVSELYRFFVTQCTLDEPLLKKKERELDAIHEAMQGLARCSPAERIAVADSLTYLSDDILTKVDRAAMHNSLETRVPLLSPDLVEFSWSLPESMKINRGNGKRILRDVLENYVPKDFYDRPKMGFGVPLDEWLRGPLKGWAEGLLTPSLIEEHGYFESSVVTDKWRAHQSGKRNYQHLLWNILTFQQWLQAQ